MPDPKVTLREELIFLLNHAAELEHSLSCSYLFTALSLKNRLEDGLTAETLAAVQRWRGVFLDIAIDEMMHLAIVNNLLVAVGAAPHFDRPNFPHGCDYYMPDLVIALQPFNVETMQHFIAVEQPTGSNLPYPDVPSARRVEGDLDNDIGADPHDMDSQGDLYGMLASGLRYMSMRLGETGLFIGPPPRQPVRAFLESSGWRPTTDLRSSLRAVAQIVEQGEGASGDNPDSHYWRFRAILDEYRSWKQVDPDFEPAYPVIANPFARTPPEAQGQVNLIDDEFAIKVSDLFNEAYGALLLLLGRFFALTEETDEEGALLIDAAIAVMAEVLMPMGDLLVRLPAGDEHPGRTAGPSFVVRTVHTLPYKASAWRLIEERLGELRDHAHELASARKDATATLTAAGDTFARLGAMLAGAPATGFVVGAGDG